MKPAALEIFVRDELRQTKLLGGDENELYIFVSRHRRYERVDRSAVFQIAAETYREVIKRTLFAVDGQQVGERLRGMKMSAVSRIYQRHRRVHRRYHGSPLLRVAHGDYVGVAVDYLYCVGESLALRGGAGARAGETDDLTAEREHRALEAESRARRGLKKQRCENLVAADLVIFFWLRRYIVGNRYKPVNLLCGEVENIYYAPHFAPPIQLSSEGLLRKAIRRLTSSGFI